MQVGVFVVVVVVVVAVVVAVGVMRRFNTAGGKPQQS